MGSTVLEVIDSRAFMSCTKLKNVSIPSSVTTFGELLFDGCYEIAFNVFGNAKYVGNETDKYIYLCKAESEDITSVEIASGTKAIAGAAFFGCSKLTSVAIPDSVISLEGNVFYECTSLKTVTLGNNLTSIGSNVFTGCTALESINIPASVTSIGAYVFAGCDALNATAYGNAKYLGNDQNPYLYLLCATSKDVTEVTAHKDTIFVGSGSLSEYEKLVSVSLPEGLKYIGDSAFHSCYKLSQINIPSTVVEIGAAAFVCCEELVEIVIPDGVTVIDAHMFSQCTKLQSVSIPSSVFYISSGVFNECSSLQSIIFRGNKSQWDRINKSSSWQNGTGNYGIVCNDVTVEKA